MTQPRARNILYPVTTFQSSNMNDASVLLEMRGHLRNLNLAEAAEFMRAHESFSFSLTHFLKDR